MRLIFAPLLVALPLCVLPAAPGTPRGNNASRSRRDVAAIIRHERIPLPKEDNAYFAWLASQDAVPYAVLERLLAQLPSAPEADNALATTYRCELAYACLASLDRMRESIPEATNKLTLAVLQTFDEEATAQLLGECFATAIENTGRTWSDRDRSVHQDLAALQGSLKRDGLEVWADIFPPADQELTEEEEKKKIEELRAAAQWCPNLAGRMLVSMIMPAVHGALEHSFRARTEGNATRAIIATHMLRRKTKRLPHSARELVDQGLLKEIPVDFFSGKALRYSGTRGFLWSVGPDGVDNLGKRAKQKQDSASDLVYDVFPSKRVPSR